jgi:hypothetical protein
MSSGQVLVAPSYDGANLAAPTALINIQSDRFLRIDGGMVDCKNFNLIIQGTFNLSTVIIEATTTGKV